MAGPGYGTKWRTQKSLCGDSQMWSRVISQRSLRFARLYVLALMLSLFSGCVRPVSRTRTIVTGKIEPRQIHFITAVEQAEEGPGGWRAACVHVRITRRNTGESFNCRFGVEVPIENRNGPISVSLAQRIVAERTNETARIVLGAATLDSPIGLLCEEFKKTLRPLLQASIEGARLKMKCHEKAVPVQLGEVALRAHVSIERTVDGHCTRLLSCRQGACSQAGRKPGSSKLPREVAETPVRLFVQWVEPPETTLFHALFSNEPDNVP